MSRADSTRTRKPSRPLPVLAVSAEELAAMLGLSKRSVNSYHQAGLIPKPFKLAGRTLWNVDEIRRWLDADAVARDRWEALKSGSSN